MDTSVLMAVLSFVGTALGTLGGIMTSARLTNHRLRELEKKVEKHNRLVERMTAVEQHVKHNARRLDAAGV